jgi:ferredoxin--NADP+ reductase
VTSSQTPLRVAIVGAGPAGFYAADKLLKAPDLDVEVELFDRLPTPWGLVRAGVAPDHPNIKAVSRIYEKTAALPGFRFHGNVEIGATLTHEDLLKHHHAVLYAVGAAGDRRLGIDGEDLAGSHGATEFVAWYNGHPDACDFAFDLQGERAVVVGNGNVALDVARMLVLTRSELEVTDIADHALEALAESNITEVVVLGRRGPAQAAYTTPELRELGELTDADVIVDPAEAALDGASQVWLDSDAADRATRNNVSVVQEYAEREPSGKRKRVVLRYLVSPVEILGDEHGHVSGIRIVRNEPVATEDGTVRAKATDVEEVLDCSLVMRSIGYRGLAVDGVPFDDRAATIANAGGRVIDPATGEPVPGVYTAGWIKRGPSGVIGTNKKCANETVALLLEDFAAGKLPPPEAASAADLDALMDSRGNGRIDYAGWERIDAHEKAAGKASGRPRVKLARLDELLARGSATD